VVDVLETVVMVASESKDDQSNGHQLVDGHTVTLLSDALVVADAMGRESTRIRLEEITIMQRGGADIIVVRGYHDPVTLRFAGVAAATAFERSLNAVKRRGSPEQPQRRWWLRLFGVDE
jgi:hypothetical protein